MLVIEKLYEFNNLGHEIPQALRDASKKLIESKQKEEEEEPMSKLPEYNSSAAVAQTIGEDEEMAEGDLELELNNRNSRNQLPFRNIPCTTLGFPLRLTLQMSRTG
jgi:hypothetical protein